jgi:transcriptional regulator of PTS gene
VITDPRTQSRRQILDAIRKAGRIARIDLAQSLNISQATVTTITAQMIRVGLVEELAPEEDSTQPRRGRPRVDLKLRGAAHVVAGLKVADRSISIVLVDFEGTVIAEHTFDMHKSRLPVDEMIANIDRALQETCALVAVPLASLSAVGVGIAGVVNADRGFVHWSPFFRERNIELGAKLSRALGKPVFIDNDTNLVAVAEQTLGFGRDVSNFVVVTIETGVGMGIVINDQLYRGARGCGAEFGHIKVHLDGALCRCGQRGCLEAYVADYALLREAEIISGPADAAPADRRVQALLEAARGGDATAQSIVNRSSRMFAMGLSNLVNLFDPQLIILSGERMQFDHLYAADVMAAIKDSIVQVDADPPEIVIHKWGDFMWARGAAMFALAGVAESALQEIAENAA